MRSSLEKCVPLKHRTARPVRQLVLSYRGTFSRNTIMLPQTGECGEHCINASLYPISLACPVTTLSKGQLNEGFILSDR